MDEFSIRLLANAMWSAALLSFTKGTVLHISQIGMGIEGERGKNLWKWIRTISHHAYATGGIHFRTYQNRAQ